MARNEEKSQSMLFRFREAQAVELGISKGRNDRRPRLASSCDNLKDCERWRGEILREISRKVSKIQDIGLTDYEIRDLNDEINKLMREKKHWERQIVQLGGANYTRNTAMLDEDGKEVPGTRGYKYFGRAKELPGVKELFSKKAVSADEETARSDLYQMFQNQGPDYYGDFDELNSNLLEAEREAEIKDWDAAYARITEVLSLPSTSTPIPFPLASAPAQPISSTLAPSATTAASKRPANDDETEETSMTVDEPTPASPSSKKAKLTSTSAAEETASTNAPPAQSFQALSVLKQEDLQPPTLPTKEEMEKLLLERRKAALLAEYAN